MTITASVIADSINSDGHRITTMVMRYPRFIHAEFMTHRVFSRNASSSRAIPIEKMIQDVLDDPAMPVAWGSNKPGMQAGEECTNGIEFMGLDDGLFYTFTREEAWLNACHNAVQSARCFSKAGYHKQIVNRLLEPFAHISVICTATEWDNFFALRCHPDADPTMRALAEAMRDAIDGSTPATQTWHLPYFTQSDAEAIWAKNETGGGHDFDTFAMISAARCARVSYLNHDGSNPDIEKDLVLAERLATSKHMSPFEHQAMSIDNGNIRSANFIGWAQYRALMEANP